MYIYLKKEKEYFKIISLRFNHPQASLRTLCSTLSDWQGRVRKELNLVDEDEKLRNQRWIIRCLIPGGGSLYIVSIMSDTDAETCIPHTTTLTYCIIFFPEILCCIAWRYSIKPRGNTESESYRFDISSSAVTARPKYSLRAPFSLAWNCRVLKQFIHWINL